MTKPLLLLDNPDSMATIAEVIPDKFQLILLDTPPILAQCDLATFCPPEEKAFSFPAKDTWQQKLSAMLAGHEVFLGFGEEPEGEYLSWIIQGYAREQGLPEPHRLHLAGLTKSAILDALKQIDPVDHLGPITIYTRALFRHCFQGHLKRLLGTIHGPGSLVISPFIITVLTLMAERETEIVPPNQTNSLQLQVTLNNSALTLPITITEIFNVSGDGLLQDNHQANEISKRITNEHFTILDQETSPFSLEPLPPYDLFSLLTDACMFHQIRPEKALSHIKELFCQGGKLANLRQGLISSPFPSTTHYRKKITQLIQTTVANKFGSDAISPRDIEPQAILPLQPELTADDLGLKDSAKGQIYELIRCRALAWQMQNAAGKRLQLHLESKLCRGIGQDNQLTTPGFLLQDDKGFPPWNHSPRLDMNFKTPFSVDQVMVSHYSQPTNTRYTISDLWEELTEFRGIYSQEDITQLLQLLDKGYISLEDDGQLHCQANLQKVTKGLDRAFPGMKGLNLMAYYEQTVAEAISGRKNIAVALRQFDQNLVMHGTPLHKPKITANIPKKRKKSSKLIKSGPSKIIAQSQPEPSPAPLFADLSPSAQQDEQITSKPEPALTEETCPIAQEEEPAPVTEEASPETPTPLSTATDLPPTISPSAQVNPPTSIPSAQENLAVTDHEPPRPPAPQTEKASISPTPQQPLAPAHQPPIAPTKPTPEAATPPTTKPCPECGRPMVLKTDRFGKYWSCSGYPACHHSETKHSNETPEELACPICDHTPLSINRTPTGKEMYVCPSKNCDFMSWAKPHQEMCPICHHPFLVENSDAHGQISLRCPKAGCRYKRALTAEQSSEPPIAKKKVIRRKKARSGKGKKRLVVRRKK